MPSETTPRGIPLFSCRVSSHFGLWTSRRQRDHLSRPHRQALGSRHLNSVVVLDPHAETLGDVDTGLDRLDVAGGERLLVAADEVGRLVPVHAEAVTQTVREGLAVSGVLDDLPRSPVHVFGRHAGLQGFDPRYLGAVHDGINLPELVGGRTEADGARDVAAVPAN